MTLINIWFDGGVFFFFFKSMFTVEKWKGELMRYTVYLHLVVSNSSHVRNLGSNWVDLVEEVIPFH